jgi:hypothetical protein
MTATKARKAKSPTLQNTFPGGFTGLVRTAYEVGGLLSGFCCSQLGQAGSAKLVQA